MPRNELYIYNPNTGEEYGRVFPDGCTLTTQREEILESLASAYAERDWYRNFYWSQVRDNVSDDYWYSWQEDADRRIKQLQAQLAEISQ